VQFLKKLYRNSVATLGAWGVTVDADDRVVYPTDFVGRQAVVIAFIAKHNSFVPGTSPLQPYLDENAIPLATEKTAAIEALTAHNDFLAQDNIREEKHMERDVTISPVATHLRGEGQFLVQLFHNIPKKANEWGFEIDDSPQGDVVREGIVPAAQSKVLRNLDVGKQFRNIGPTVLNIYPGDSQIGTATVVQAGGTFNVVRGFGVMTVLNPDNVHDGAYQAQFHA
jgi:hypothetical protein